MLVWYVRLSIDRMVQESLAKFRAILALKNDGKYVL